MKKIISAVLSILLAVNFFAVCAMADNENNGDIPGDAYEQPEQGENTDIGNQDSGGEPAPEPEQPSQPEQPPEQEQTPTTPATPTATPNVSGLNDSKPTLNLSPGVPYVTKDPLGETVKEGGEVVFIVKAEQVEYYVWEFISPDSQTVFAAGNVSERFKNVKIEGVGTDTITIKNVPLRMDGWRVLCLLKGTRANVNSQQARIHVVSANPLSPKLSAMPSGGSCEMGQSLVLSVTARELNENGVLNYQWYKTDRDTNSGGQAISGENSPSLTVPQLLGTYYYYVEVWSTVDGEQSPKSVSTACAVTFKEAKAAPLPTEGPAVAEEENLAWGEDEEEGVNWLLIAFIAISLLAAAVAGYMVYTIIDDYKKEKQSAQAQGESGNEQTDAPAAPESNESGAEPVPENKAEETVGEAEEPVEEAQPVQIPVTVQTEEKPEVPAADTGKKSGKHAKPERRSIFGMRKQKASIPEEPSNVQSDEAGKPQQHELEYRSRVEELAKILNETDE